MKDHKEDPPVFGEDIEVLMSPYPENRSQDRVNTQREIPHSDNGTVPNQIQTIF